MKIFEYLYVFIAFVVSCLLFFVVLYVTGVTVPGKSFPPAYQAFFCCGLLYPVIVIISYYVVVMRLIKKRKVGLLPVLPIIYFFTYMAVFVMMIIIHDTLIYL